MEFSFLQIADMHLGRPFTDLSDIGDKMAICNEACRNALTKITELALQKKVEFILIAGDSFDSEEHDLSTKLMFLNFLKNLADEGIKSYVICGNHDPIKLYKKYKNYFKFEDKYKGLINITGVTTEDYKQTYVVSEGVNIQSISFSMEEMENPKNDLSGMETNKGFNIGLIHCEIDKKESKYAPITRAELLDLGFDYYALGHIHLPQECDEKIVYSGTIQGRTKKEKDAHGCYYIKVKDNSITEKEFIPVDTVRFTDIEIDCSEFTNKIELFEKISEAENNSDLKLSLLSINLTGVSKIYGELIKSENLLEEYQTDYSNGSNICVYDIVNNTLPDVDDNEFMNDTGVVGIIANAEEEGIDFEEIYDGIKNIHENIYKKLGLDQESKEYLLSALDIEKSEIVENTKNELKNLCKEIYSIEDKS